MEDSSIKSEYVIYDDIDNSDRFKNISDLKEYM